MRTIPIRNTEIEVDLINVKSTLAPIIFLHEGLGSVDMWRSKLGYWPELVCQATGRKDRKSTRLNSSHVSESRMPSSA